MEEYFFGPESMVGKKVKLLIRESRKKQEKREAYIIYDDADIIVVKYVDLKWCESFNRADIVDGTLEVRFCG
jgi:uncharacterized protein Veg